MWNDIATPSTLAFEPVKGLPQVFVALVIGGIAAWIAFRQWSVGRAKLKLDLFEKMLCGTDQVR